MLDAGITAIDSHAHVFARGLPLAAQRRHAPDYDAMLGEYLGHLDRSGISHGVLVQPSFLGTDNSYLLSAVRQYPQRLRGVAMVPLGVTDEELTRQAAQGVVDVPDFVAPQWQSLLTRVCALGWHVEVHREACDLPCILDAVLLSGCEVVVDHFGRPDPAAGVNDPGFAALLRVADSGRVWVKLSAAYRNARVSRLPLLERAAALVQQDAAAATAAASALLRAFGADRLVWGSDWPHTQHQDLVDFAGSRALLDNWIPDAAQRRRILVDTPAALYRFR